MHLNRTVVLITVLLLSVTALSLSAQEAWFQAQSDRAVVKSIVSTSELVEGQYDGKYLYPPINLLDGDFDTTWCEADQGGSGIGESITLELAEPLSFNEIQVVNGFASGNDYYHKNNRVAGITLTQTAGEHFQQKQYTLEDDTEGWQSIQFDLIQTAQIINIRIDEVYRGFKYDDTCFSDLRFLMDGRVIPFENVEKIKAVQEEHSRSLLNATKGAFMNRIREMAEADGMPRRLYLLKKGSREGLFFSFRESEDFSGQRIKFSVTPFEFYQADDDTFDYGRLDYSMVFDAADNMLDIDRSRAGLQSVMAGRPSFVYETFDWGSYDTEYYLSDYKLITRRNIDYVQTETVELLKLDGDKGLYINGVYYERLPEDPMLFLREEP